MSANRVIVDRLHEAFNARRFDVYPDLLDEDVLAVLGGRSLQGAAAVCDYVVVFVEEVRGVRSELERVIVDSGHTIVVQTRYVDASPTSQPAMWGAWRLPVTLCEVYRTADDRIVEWQIYLGAELSGQLSGREVVSWPGITQLVAEQTALRRVATLVGRGADQTALFDAIVTETAELFREETWLSRFGADGARTVVAAHGGRLPRERVGVTVLADSAVAKTLRSGRSARVDDLAELSSPGAELARRLGFVAAAAVPLVVQGAVWGDLMVISAVGLADGIEDRLAQFADLAATAVANAQSRAELQSLADEQAALRRVAELVARGAATQDVFDQVTVEAGRLLDEAPTQLFRYERSGTEAVILAESAPKELGLAEIEPLSTVGARVPVAGESGRARVWRTAKAARIDSDTDLPAGAAGVGIGASVSTPIVVDGRLWGVLSAGSLGLPLPAGTEQRLARFCELVAAAIANAESRAALTASRARIVASADEARRRLARDVHDGAQQRQVHAIITLKQAQAALEDTDSPAAGLVAESLAQAQAANAQLRELAHGILPAALARGGLRAGVDALLSDIALPVDAEVLAGRLPERVETTAYFVVAEALTNVVKHAGADRARVRALAAAGWLKVEVSDDGRGGAVPAQGLGLIGLIDRVDAAGGSMSLTSQPDAGTTLSITLPIELSDASERP